MQSSRLRILWISRSVSNNEGGDAVFDREMVSNVAERHQIETLALEPGSLRESLVGSALNLVPPERARFATAKNFRGVRRG